MICRSLVSTPGIGWAVLLPSVEAGFLSVLSVTMAEAFSVAVSVHSEEGFPGTSWSMSSVDYPGQSTDPLWQRMKTGSPSVPSGSDTSRCGRGTVLGGFTTRSSSTVRVQMGTASAVVSILKTAYWSSEVPHIRPMSEKQVVSQSGDSTPWANGNSKRDCWLKTELKVITSEPPYR